jgi:hypothetical protein
MKVTNTLSYYQVRAEEARSRAERATDPSIREFFATLSCRYQDIAANLKRARRPTLSLRLGQTEAANLPQAGASAAL